MFEYSTVLNIIVVLTSLLGTECRKPSVFDFVGVSPQDHHLYNPTKDFTCKDGGVTIPFQKVNDEFCDCPDGSDEPSTSACPNGMFYCKNEGFQGHFVPSSRVNDGVCDCCDGSDEWNEKTCGNTCIVSEFKEEKIEEKPVEHLEDGDVSVEDVSDDLDIDEFQKMSAGRRKQLETIKKLSIERSEAEKISKQLENEVKRAEDDALKTIGDALESESGSKNITEIEARERAELLEDKIAQEVFGELDTSGDGILDLSEVQAVKIFDLNKNGVVEDEEIRWYFLAPRGTVDSEIFRERMWRHMGRLYVLEKEIERAVYYDARFPERDEDERKPNKEFMNKYYYKPRAEMRKREAEKRKKRESEPSTEAPEPPKPEFKNSDEFFDDDDDEEEPDEAFKHVLEARKKFKLAKEKLAKTTR